MDRATFVSERAKCAVIDRAYSSKERQKRISRGLLQSAANERSVTSCPDARLRAAGPQVAAGSQAEVAQHAGHQADEQRTWRPA